MMKLPENIEKLLRSKLLEDVLLGVDYIYQRFGKSGIQDTFDAAKTLTAYHAKYSTFGISDNALVEYDDVNVWIGPGFIEYGMELEEFSNVTHIKRINFKTKQNE